MTAQTGARKRSWEWLGVAALLAVYWWMAVSVSPRMGLTADEPSHLTAGYSYWRCNDYRLQPESGMLPMRLAALPLLAMNVHWVPANDADWNHAVVSRVANTFLFDRANPRDRMVAAGRAMIALLGVFTIWLIWRWARHLFGPAGGWIALTVAAFSPTLLAQGGLTTADMAITAALLAAMTAYWRLLHVVSWTNVALASVALVAALLAKMSGILALPMFAILLVVRWLRPTPLIVRLRGAGTWRRPRTAIIGTTVGATLAMGIGALILLWGAYGFRYSALAPGHAPDAQFELTWNEVLHAGTPADGTAGAPVTSTAAAARPFVPRVIAWTREHRLLPEAYLWGVAHTYKFSRRRLAFLDGDARATGWTRFFPLTFWYKTTLPTLGLFAAGLAAFAATRRRERAGSRWYRASPLAALFVLYWAAALHTPLNIGQRHIVPTYPVVFVFAGAAALWLARGPRRLVAAALALAVVAQVSDSLAARPFYLSYFQPLAGGTANGWHHLVDSSYDWGQGLPDLATWIAARHAAGDRDPVYLTYFGADSPRARRLPVIRFADEINDTGMRTFPVRPGGGWFAISATHFQRVYLHLSGPWTDARERRYQQLRLALSGAGTPPDQAHLLPEAMEFEVLEFGRLCHWLKDRKPVAIVGGSILLFHLSAPEVRFALNAPLTDVDHSLALTTAH
ncbi:MAG TPA: hypothetical protein VHE61_04210 [Opitutaceae bacterium]|nr:hypothetical protein [Opitutaceae bacterium]